jgi:SSS family solute:Na+ symporter
VLPAGLRGIIIAALFSDIMQSLSGGISALGSALVTDFKSVFARGITDERALTRRARIVGLFVGTAAIGLSYVIVYVPGRNFYDISYRLSSFFMVPLFVAFAMAFFVRFATPAGAWAAIVVGFAAGVVFSYWRQIVGRVVPTADFSVILILPATLLCSLAAGLLASLLTQSSRRGAAS